MSRRRNAYAIQNPFFKSFELWSGLARNNAAMLWSAGDVIGRRTTRMAQHGAAPNADDSREMHRMVSEKQSAMVEAGMAAWSQWMRSSQAMWTDALLNGGRARRAGISTSRAAKHLVNAQLKIANAAMKPLHTRVAANQKRLSNKRTSRAG